jgi:hypothetical protein
MKVAIGKEGLTQTWQRDFPEETKCVHCEHGEARIAFVAHELGSLQDKRPGEEFCRDENGQELICSLHKNDRAGEGMWLHDCCAVAVYFCKDCLEATTLWNQA